MRQPPTDGRRAAIFGASSIHSLARAFPCDLGQPVLAASAWQHSTTELYGLENMRASRHFGTCPIASCDCFYDKAMLPRSVRQAPPRTKRRRSQQCNGIMQCVQTFHEKTVMCGGVNGPVEGKVVPVAHVRVG